MNKRDYRAASVVITTVITTALAALLLSACSSDSMQNNTTEDLTTDTNYSTDASDTTETTNFTSTDLMFAEMMIPHHEQAVAMSELALERSQNPEVIALAEQILDAQATEIKKMKTWGDLNLESHAGHMMMGMLTSAQMSALAASTGPEFDRLFLEGMIVHHEGAIQMAQMVTQSTNSEAKELGEEIVVSQTAEIELIQKLLAAK